MSTTMTLDEVEGKLRQVIASLDQGDEVAISDGTRIVARIVGEPPPLKERPGPGLLKGMIIIVEDDDEHLEHFAEYMP